MVRWSFKAPSNLVRLGLAASTRGEDEKEGGRRGREANEGGGRRRRRGCEERGRRGRRERRWMEGGRGGMVQKRVEEDTEYREKRDRQLHRYQVAHTNVTADEDLTNSSATTVSTPTHQNHLPMWICP